MRRSQLFAAAALSCVLATAAVALPARAADGAASAQGRTQVVEVLDKPADEAGDDAQAVTPPSTDNAADGDAAADGAAADSASTDDANKSQVNGTDGAADSAVEKDAASDGDATTTDPAADEAAAQADAKATAQLTAQAHVANEGWMGSATATAGKTLQAGTTGRGLQMEALRLSLSGVDGSVEIQAHVANEGWVSWSANEAGTTGRGWALEALRVRLTGAAANSYDIYYRVHVANVGWMGWTKDGDAAGTQGFGNAIECVEFQLVAKGEKAPATGTAFQAKNPMSIGVTVNVSGRGWQTATAGKAAGTTGQSRHITGLSMAVDSANWVTGSVQYRVSTSLSSLGNWTDAGKAVSSATGNAPVQAIAVRLTGDMASTYDVYYRVHASNVGWMGWAKNGESAGSEDATQAAEAIQVVLVEKGGAAPAGSTANAYASCSSAQLRGQAHVSNEGWLDLEAGSEVTLGTTGKSLQLEALTLGIAGAGLDGSAVSVEAHVANLGWQAATTGIAGTTGRGYAVEAVKMSLTGAAAEKYDLYYQAHVAGIGWLGWTKAGSAAGSQGYGRAVECVRVRLVAKGQSGPGSGTTAFLTAPTVSYEAHVQDIGWQGAKTNGAFAGTTGQSKRVEAFKVSLSTDISGSINYQAHVSDIGWQASVKDGAVAGTTGQSKQVEAVKIWLSGDISNYYDVYYRVYVENFGWMGWTSNGSAAGTSKIGYRVEGIEVRLVFKGQGAPGSTANSYRESLPAYQTPGNWPKLTYKQVTLPSYATGFWTYVHPYTLPNGATRSQCIETMINVAYEYMQTVTPWVDNHCSRPGDQIDCSGLIMEGLYACGMSLDGVAGGDFNPWTKFYQNHHFANTWRLSNTFQPVSFADRERGDIIYWEGHVGIYLGNNQIIDAYPNQSVGVHSVYSRGTILGVARPFPKA